MQIALVRDAYDYAARPTRASGGAPATLTSRIRWRWPTSWPHMRMDHETVMAALLHDVIEDTEVARGNLRERYGESVAQIVDGVSKLSTIFRTRPKPRPRTSRRWPWPWPRTSA
jgi:(p)ppGpp synthase/HD superfamily hydrolase